MQVQRREVVTFIAVFAFVCVCFYLMLDNTAISLTESDGYRVFVRKKCEFKRGEYVSFKPPKSAKYAPRGFYFIKKIMCVPGDVIERDGRWFYCNGKKLAYALKKTKWGAPLEPWNIKKIVVPENTFFVKGSMWRSYDSRYFGLIHKKDIIACYRPLF